MQGGGGAEGCSGADIVEVMTKCRGGASAGAEGVQRCREDSEVQLCRFSGERVHWCSVQWCRWSVAEVVHIGCTVAVVQ